MKIKSVYAKLKSREKSKEDAGAKYPSLVFCTAIALLVQFTSALQRNVQFTGYVAAGKHCSRNDCRWILLAGSFGVKQTPL